MSQPGDRFEQEAERAAEQATGALAAGQAEVTKIPPAHSSGQSGFYSAVSKTGGQPLPESERHFFEA